MNRELMIRAKKFLSDFKATTPVYHYEYRPPIGAKDFAYVEYTEVSTPITSDDTVHVTIPVIRVRHVTDDLNSLEYIELANYIGAKYSIQKMDEMPKYNRDSNTLEFTMTYVAVEQVMDFG